MGSKDSPVKIVHVVPDDGDGDVSILHSSPQIVSLPSVTKGGTNKDNAISVENYDSNNSIDLQLAIMASINSSAGGSGRRRRRRRNSSSSFIDLSEDSEYPDHDDLQFQILDSYGIKKRNPSYGISIFERGQSSNSSKPHNVVVDDDDDDPVSPIFICEICVEQKPLKESFSIKGCSHSYCSDCIHRYVASKIQDNISRISCPVSGCSGVLEPEHCRAILPPEVFDRWGDALCEALILASDKFYCPFKDCSALLIQEGGGNKGIIESECPVCRRLFCAQCKVPWHTGIKCRDFEKLHKDEREREDIMLMQLAKKNKWNRCPRCKFFVEKSAGCLFMICRCGYSFCYNCGAPLKDHYCTKCKH